MLPSFTETEAVKLLVGGLWDLFGDLDRGTLIKWEDIEKCIGHHHLSNEGRHLVGKWRQQMLKVRSIATRAECGVGVRLLTNEQQAVECGEDRQRRAHRQCNRAINEVSAVDGSSLGMHHRRLQNATLSTLRIARKQIRSGVKEIVATTKTHPIRKVN